MRYWLFEEDRLEGPLSTEELKARPKFDRRTLVHPEERLDPASERWKPAGDVPQLALLLAAKEGALHAGSFLPPEPTVRDLPVLGALLEQVERLEGVLVGMRSELKGHDDELSALRADGKVKDERAAALEAALAALTARLEALEPLPGRFAALGESFKASEAERSALTARLAALSAELEAEREKAKAVQAEIPARFAALAEEESALRRALDEARLEGETLARGLAEAKSELDRTRGELQALGSREEGRWKWGDLRLSPQRLAWAAVCIGLLALGALAAAFLYKKTPPPAPAAKAPVVPAEPVPIAQPAPPPPAAVEPPAAPRPAPVKKPKARPKPKPKPAGDPVRRAILERTSRQEEAAAAAFVKSYLSPSPAPKPCPRTMEEVRTGEAGPARTPLEASDCWAWTRLSAAAEGLAAARGLERGHALSALENDLAGWGGFAAVFPAVESVRRVGGRQFEVELRRDDLLGRKIHERYGLSVSSGSAALSLRYEVDLASASLRPLTLDAWRSLDASSAAPGLKPPEFTRGTRPPFTNGPNPP